MFQDLEDAPFRVKVTLEVFAPSSLQWKSRHRENYIANVYSMITTTKALHESKVALEKLGQPLFNANVHV